MSPRHDETTELGHIGAALRRADQVWRAAFTARMLALGHPVVNEAASQALVLIPSEGATQSAIGRGLGISKQAAQQFVNQLIRAGFVIRRPDAQDHRANRILLTDEGQRFAQDATRVTAEIEALYRAAIGNSAFAFLRATLTRLPGIDDSDTAPGDEE